MREQNKSGFHMINYLRLPGEYLLLTIKQNVKYVTNNA